MKAINDKDLKIKICELMLACYSDNFEDAYKAKADLFLWIEKVCNDRDDALREVDYLTGQLESANIDCNNAMKRLENLKKYGAEVPDIRDMYPAEMLRNAKQHLNEMYGNAITTDDNLDPEDYKAKEFTDPDAYLYDEDLPKKDGDDE